MSLPKPPFTFGERVGILLLAETAGLSAVAVTILLCYIAYSAVSIRPGSVRKWKAESPVHLYFLNQLVCDLVQAIGGLMNIKWIVDAAVIEGDYCTAQGVIKQIGDVGTALSALSVALYTFTTLIFRWKPDTSVPRGVLVVLGIWVFLALIIGINVGVNGASHFYGNTGYWCWIVEEFKVQRTVLDYMWMWISAFFSILAYVPAFLVLRGFIQIDGWRVRISPTTGAVYISPAHRIAYNMLFYPTLYIITVLPLAIVRYSTFTHHRIPFAATVVADCLFLSSGLLNVLLYTVTRPFLLPHGERGLGSISMHARTYPDDFAQSQSRIARIHEAAQGTLGRDSPDVEGKMFGDDVGFPSAIHSHDPSFSSTSGLWDSR